MAEEEKKLEVFPIGITAKEIVKVVEDAGISGGGVSEITADNINSGAATNGQVLTADGSGGAAWANASGGGFEFEEITPSPATVGGLWSAIGETSLTEPKLAKIVISGTPFYVAFTLAYAGGPYNLKVVGFNGELFFSGSYSLEQQLYALFNYNQSVKVAHLDKALPNEPDEDGTYVLKGVQDSGYFAKSWEIDSGSGGSCAVKEVDFTSAASQTVEDFLTAIGYDTTNKPAASVFCDLKFSLWGSPREFVGVFNIASDSGKCSICVEKALYNPTSQTGTLSLQYIACNWEDISTTDISGLMTNALVLATATVGA